MPPKIEKNDSQVVIIDSSDDENGAVPGTSNAAFNKTPSEAGPLSLFQQQNNLESNTVSLVPGNVVPRSFWKAGDYVVGPIVKPPPVQGYLEHARVHPKFLHSNATSHKWAFGAIAELMDNAVDEIQNGATFVKIDKLDIMKDNSPALLVLDDGGGMDPESLRKCMSLGYSSKKSKTTIGQYGNGFKTSTMRLGADVIVFSRAMRSRKTQSVGLLSYTFLRRTGQDHVIVPLIDFDISGHWAEPVIYSSEEDWSANLKTILDWSPFASKEELMLQFDDIGSHGTKVVIYNLWLNDEGVYELSFDDDAEDIRLRDEVNRGDVKKLNKKAVQLQSHISYLFHYSLRAYASMLYLRKFPNFKIILRGQPVEQFDIVEELKHSQVVTYKPQLGMASKEVTVMTTIGFVKEAPSLNVSGFNVYHKNRLIKPFWKVTGDGSSKGNGVVGVLEVNFVEPAHDKQDFERSLLFIRLESRLKQMTMEYWKSHCHLVGYQPPNFKSRNVPHGSEVQHSTGHLSKSQDESLAVQRAIGMAEHQEDSSLDQSIAGLPANVQYLQEQHVVGAPGSQSVDQIRDENLRLFWRCEEHMRKETELKQMVENLEKELEEAQGKCAQLSSLLEAKRRQKKIELKKN
ncbi:protein MICRORCHIDIA 2-like isoform X2 [Prosopis cineraria]|uniref:protein MICRORCHIDIA 2-like isoform X2 n=1 Tax=Prosopis cineraria TaxID=364024 RepID=UPI00240EB18E|nr:protein MICRORCHIDIA 2-like isoform X2 [Prosopis cineraria]